MGGDGRKIKARTGDRVRAREEAAAGRSGKADGEKRQPAGRRGRRVCRKKADRFPVRQTGEISSGTQRTGPKPVRGRLRVSRTNGFPA